MTIDQLVKECRILGDIMAACTPENLEALLDKMEVLANYRNKQIARGEK